jgi:uncharacterized protein (DUF2062 family)
MFQRKKKKPVSKVILNFIWPSIGWKRLLRFWMIRISRLPGSVYSISAGFACGAAISFTPFVGLHFILGALLAWCIRSNIVASAIGTAIGNPWTFPFIWTWTHNLGLWMGFDAERIVSNNDSISEFFFDKTYEAILNFDFILIGETIWPIIGPMLLGCLPTVIFVWFLFYFLIRALITYYRQSITENNIH